MYDNNRLNDLQEFSDHLPDTFKAGLPGDLTENIKYDFHSANYHLLIEVQTALKTIIGHLIKALKKDDLDRSIDDESFKTLKVSEFLRDLYDDSDLSVDDIFVKIGIKRESCAHIRCLADLPLTIIYSCLGLFVNWVDKGFYDYSTLPYHLKKNMDDGDKKDLERVIGQWQGTREEVMKRLKKLTEILKESEQDLASGANDADVSWPKVIGRASKATLS